MLLCIATFYAAIGNDFISDTSRHITFSSGTEIGSQRCISVMTNVDTIVEGDQEFTVSLVEVNSDPVSVVLISTPSDQSVTIQDNIGMVFYCLIYFVYFTSYTNFIILQSSLPHLQHLLLRVNCLWRHVSYYQTVHWSVI